MTALPGVFRCDDRCRHMRLHAGCSDDGWQWRIEPEPITFVTQDPDAGSFEYGYDPRVCWLEDRFYVTWCNGLSRSRRLEWPIHTISKPFHQLDNAFLPYNRNGVLFPRRIKGKYAMLSRPSDTGHTPFGDIFYSESPDLCPLGTASLGDGPKRTGLAKH